MASGSLEMIINLHKQDSIFVFDVSSYYKYGQIRGRARWINSYAAIGYPSWQNGAILPVGTTNINRISQEKFFSKAI